MQGRDVRGGQSSRPASVPLTWASLKHPIAVDERRAPLGDEGVYGVVGVGLVTFESPKAKAAAMVLSGLPGPSLNSNNGCNSFLGAYRVLETLHTLFLSQLL